VTPLPIHWHAPAHRDFWRVTVVSDLDQTIGRLNGMMLKELQYRDYRGVLDIAFCLLGGDNSRIVDRRTPQTILGRDLLIPIFEKYDAVGGCSSRSIHTDICSSQKQIPTNQRSLEVPLLSAPYTTDKVIHTTFLSSARPLSLPCRCLLSTGLKFCTTRRRRDAGAYTHIFRCRKQ
jgi:hypothetical protein